MRFTLMGLLWLALPCLSAAVVISVPGDQPNLHFPSVRVNDIPIDTVSTDMKVGYAHFAFSGTVTVEVITREIIN